MSFELRPPKLSTDKLRLDDFGKLNTFMDELASLLQGNLLMAQHLAMPTVQVAFTTAGAEVAVEHGLGRVPAGYIKVKDNVGTVVYDSDRAASGTRIYLKSTVANAKVSLVFF